jgi:hypothetical protein
MLDESVRMDACGQICKTKWKYWMTAGVWKVFEFQMYWDTVRIIIVRFPNVICVV